MAILILILLVFAAFELGRLTQWVTDAKTAMGSGYRTHRRP
jgi:hypothetical protein